MDINKKNTVSAVFAPHMTGVCILMKLSPVQLPRLAQSHEEVKKHGFNFLSRFEPKKVDRTNISL